MTRASLIAILIWGLLTLGLATLDGSVVALSLPLAVYFMAGLVRRPGKSRLELAARTSPHNLSDAESIEGLVELHNPGSDIDEIWISDPLPAEFSITSGIASALTQLRRGESIELRYSAAATRGLYRLPAIQISTSDTFGLFTTRWQVPAPRTVLVRPSYGRVRHIDLRPESTGTHSGLYAARRGGPGIEFHGVRPWHTGASPRRINWKASARHPGSLYVNQFELERIIDVGLIVDARARSNRISDGQSIMGSSIQAAASIAELLLTQGNRVGLLVYGSHLDWTVPGYGKLQRQRLLQALALAEEGESQVFDRLRNLPTRLFPAQSQLILFSPLLLDDVGYLRELRARRNSLLVISPNRTLAEAEALRHRDDLQVAMRLASVEQELITRRLAHAGIHRLLWDVRRPLEEVLDMRLAHSRAAAMRIRV